jgi:hypothetical protein
MGLCRRPVAAECASPGLYKLGCRKSAYAGGESVLLLLLWYVLFADGCAEAEFHKAAEHLSSDVGAARVVTQILGKFLFAAVRGFEARFNGYPRHNEKPKSNECITCCTEGAWASDFGIAPRITLRKMDRNTGEEATRKASHPGSPRGSLSASSTEDRSHAARWRCHAHKIKRWVPFITMREATIIL